MSATADMLTLAEATRIMRKAGHARIATKITQGENDCWSWDASRTNQGYGRVRWAGGNANAHRVVYELLIGRIPNGLTIDHLCGHPWCVNPAHLEPVTLRDNIARGGGVGVVNAAKTHCKHGHEFTTANTYRNAGKRHCRACGRRTAAAWHEKQRQRKIVG